MQVVDNPIGKKVAKKSNKPLVDDNGTKLIQCCNCIGGRWETECCSGANGCDCKGQMVDMGMCNVCNGTSWHLPDADTQANIRMIKGRCFIGRGPTSGFWAGR